MSLLDQEQEHGRARIVLKPTREVAIRVTDSNNAPVAAPRFKSPGSVLRLRRRPDRATMAPHGFRVPVDAKVEWIFALKSGRGSITPNTGRIDDAGRTQGGSPAARPTRVRLPDARRHPHRPDQGRRSRRKSTGRSHIRAVAATQGRPAQPDQPVDPDQRRRRPAPMASPHSTGFRRPRRPSSSGRYRKATPTAACSWKKENGDGHRHHDTNRDDPRPVAFRTADPLPASRFGRSVPAREWTTVTAALERRPTALTRCPSARAKPTPSTSTTRTGPHPRDSMWSFARESRSKASTSSSARGTVIRGTVTVGPGNRPAPDQFIRLDEAGGRAPEDLRERRRPILARGPATVRRHDRLEPATIPIRVGPGTYTVMGPPRTSE